MARADPADGGEAAWLSCTSTPLGLELEAGGRWTLETLARLDEARRRVIAGADTAAGRALISLARLEALDTAGAWLLDRLGRELQARGLAVELAGAARRHEVLLAEVGRLEVRPPARPERPGTLTRVLVEVGQGTIEAADEGRRLLAFFGQIVLTLGRVIARPSRLRLTSFTHHLEHTGVNALPIVGLISFLIGVVLAYQGAQQLRTFGAEIFTIDLLGISILREIGILLTAIVVAGRSGSAFTAQIGTMQINEEVDALRTLGLDPVEILVLPRLLALVVALPLLAFFADLMGLVGGGVMSWFVLGIAPGQYVARLDFAITPAMFVVGMIKAPVFAVLIAMVGCYQGMTVSGSAESVGGHTTRAVVDSIFLVIVFDALFSILFSYIGV